MDFKLWYANIRKGKINLTNASPFELLGYECFVVFYEDSPGW